jgi:AcrR family transcriptional regulator
MKNDRRTQYTKKIIKDTLLGLLTEKPMTNITVKELCKIADINRGTFYRYYNDIYDLFNQLEKEMISVEMISAGDLNDTKKHKKRLDYRINLIYNNQNFYKVFFSTQLHSVLLEMLIQSAHDNLLQMINEKKIQIDPTYFEYSFEYTKCGHIGVIKKWVDNGCPESPDEIAEIIVQLNKNFPTIKN